MGVRSKAIDQETKTAIEKDLEAKYGKYTELSFETVGPEVSQEVTRSASYAVAAASLGILLYIIIAFMKVDKPYRYGVAAIVAMLHDVAVEHLPLRARCPRAAAALVERPLGIAGDERAALRIADGGGEDPRERRLSDRLDD